MGDSRKIVQVRSSRQVPVRVKLLDDDIFNHNVDKRSIGWLLFDKVCEHLNILEKDYFGLNYRDPTGEKYWLNNEKKIAKQLKGQNWDFMFEVKFYPADPSQLVEDLTRYQLCLQIRRDIIDGKLPCSFVTYTLLGSYTVQSELGDYDPEEFGSGYKYLKDIQFAPHQDNELLSKIAELHKQHKGQTPEEAEMHFLSNAKKLAMYGVEMHHVQDAEGKDIQLGVCASGLIVYKDKVQINRFVWPKVLKLSYKRKKFYAKIRPGEFEDAASLIAFRLSDVKLAKRLWMICVEHHSFFRFREPEVPKGVSFLSKHGARFRFSGRTQYQSRQMVSQENREAPSFDRVMSKRGTFAGRTQNMKKRDEDRQQMREKKRRSPTTQTQSDSNSTDAEHLPEPKYPPPKAPKPSGHTKGRGPASVDSNASLDRSRESLNDLVDIPQDRKSKMAKMHAVATPLAAIFQQSIDKERLEKEKENNDRREHERDIHEDDDHDENEEVDGRSITPEIIDQDVAPVQSRPAPPMTDRDRKAFAKQEKERIKREKEAEKRQKKEEEMERKRLEKDRKKHQAEEKAAMQKKSKQKGPTRGPEHDPRDKNSRGRGREYDRTHSNSDYSPATPERTTKRLSSYADKHERNRDREDSDEDQPPTPPAPLPTAFKEREKRVDHSQSSFSESDISDDEHKDSGKHHRHEPEDEQEEISF